MIYDIIYYDVLSPTFIRLCKEHINAIGYKLYAKNEVIGTFNYRKNGMPKNITFKWNKKQYYVHSVIWEYFYHKIPDNYVIDHIDGNPFNNDIRNLRCVTRAINSRNTALSKRNSTGYIGISLTTASKGKYLYYEAFVSELNGKLKRCKFSINKLGEKVALEFAKQWREVELQRLNKEGAGYTDRHGKENYGTL